MSVYLITCSSMTKLAFDILKAKKIEIYCDSENTASTKIPKNLGFELEYTTLDGWPRLDDTLAKLQCYVLFSIDNLRK